MPAKRSASNDGDKRRLVVIDAHPVVREGLDHIISRQTDLVYCGGAAGGGDAIAIIAAHKPDLVVTDIPMRPSASVALIKRLRSAHPDTAILVFTAHDEEFLAEQILRAGANGYVGKEQPVEILLAAIRCVLSERFYLSDRIRNRLADRFTRRGRTRGGDPASLLAPRELELLRLIGRGRLAGEMAAELRLSIKTIGSYQERIKEKLGLSTAIELKCYAMRWEQDRKGPQ